MKKFINLRQSKKMTQVQIAMALSLSPSQICQYESGIRKPPINMVPKLAKILECSIEDIVMCFCDEEVTPA